MSYGYRQLGSGRTTGQVSSYRSEVNGIATAYTYTYDSNGNITRITDQSGKVTAKGEGTATITVTCGTKSAACTVTVSKPLVPEVPGTSFTDVPAGAYYEEAVGWAVKEGITKGTGATAFSPDANCIRAQIVTFLYRSMK